MKNVRVIRGSVDVDRMSCGGVKMTMEDQAFSRSITFELSPTEAMAIGQELFKAAIPEGRYVPVPYPVDLEKLEQSPKLVMPEGGS